MKICMGINNLDYEDNCYHVLKHKNKYIFLTGNKRSLAMTDVTHGSFNQCLHVQILFFCLTVNDTLINVLNNLPFIEYNNLLHNNTF